MPLSETTVGELLQTPGPIGAMVARLPFGLEDLEPESPILFAVGDVRVAELVLPPHTGVLVTGDLTVDGLLDDRPFGAHPENVRFLVVGGDLRAHRWFLGSEAVVGGSVHVRDCLVAESDGDHTLRVGGDLSGGRLVALGHHVRVVGDTASRVAIGFLGLASHVRRSELASTFVPSVVDQAGRIDVAGVAERVVAGQPIFVTDRG